MSILGFIFNVVRNFNNGAMNFMAQQNLFHNDFLQQELNRQNMESMMEEGRKMVTAFDMGGYLRGEGFNPSDTMAANAQREQMDMMNQMNMNNMF